MSNGFVCELVSNLCNNPQQATDMVDPQLHFANHLILRDVDLGYGGPADHTNFLADVAFTFEQLRKRATSDPLERSGRSTWS